MKRWIVCLTVIAILAILATVLWAAFGKRIRTTLLVGKCAKAWDGLQDYRGDFDVTAEVGPFSPTVRGTLWYKESDKFRIDLGGKQDVQLRVSGETAWLYVPDMNVAVEISFEGERPSDVAADYSLKPWLDQVREGSEIELVGKDEVEGRRCSVLELVPSRKAVVAGSRAAVPALGGDLDESFIADRWKRTRVYLDKETSLPIRVEALKDNDNILLTWTAAKADVNTGLADSEFEFDKPKGVKLRKRTYDPAKPWMLFVPPSKGHSTLDKIKDAVEDGLKEGLKDWAESELRDELDMPEGDLDRQRVEDKLLDEAFDQL